MMARIQTPSEQHSERLLPSVVLGGIKEDDMHGARRKKRRSTISYPYPKREAEEVRIEDNSSEERIKCMSVAKQGGVLEKPHGL